VRRTLVVACALTAALLAVPAVSPAQTTAVPEPSTTESVQGEPTEFAMHGDRVPPGSDARLRRRMRAAPRLAAAALPAEWCGEQRPTDDTIHASHSSGPRVKVVYAYPSGSPNRFEDYNDLIQADVRAISDYVAVASGGRRTIRFDTGTTCGPGYVDIAVVRLPRTWSDYNSPNRADHVIDDVRAALAGTSGIYNPLVYADGLYANDGVVGTAQMPIDDTGGLGNDSNRGGATAMLWGDNSPGFSDDRLTTFLHEVSHTLGAVQDSAPHSTLGGHCNEMWDVMCYADGAPQGGYTSLFYNCDSAFPILPYECGSDDYMNPAPPAGSYLARHWNVYDSAFMCAPELCVNAPALPEPAPTPTPTPTPTPAPDPTAPPVGPTPDPGQAVPEDVAAWLDGFMSSAGGSLRRVGLRGLAAGKPLVITGQAPTGYSVQFDLMVGAAAIAGGALDAGGKARLKVPRVHRRMLARMRKVRFTLQGVVRAAAGGGPPTVKRVTVTLKAPAKKKKRRR
jgi:hypothetical protein